MPRVFLLFYKNQILAVTDTQYVNAGPPLARMSGRGSACDLPSSNTWGTGALGHWGSAAMLHDDGTGTLADHPTCQQTMGCSRPGYVGTAAV